MTDPLSHRAKYHPVDDVEVVLAHTATGKRTTAATKRCAVHGRLWDSLTQQQQDAAEHIARCYRVIHGAQAPAADLTRMVEPRNRHQVPEGLYAELNRAYVDWQKACRKERIDYSIAVYVIAEGGFIRELTRSSRKRHRIREQLGNSLDVMARIMGLTSAGPKM